MKYLKSTGLLIIALVIIPAVVVYLFSLGYSNVAWGIIIPILTIFSIWAYLQIMYFIFLTFFGYKKAERDYDIQAPKTKFLIFIPCHNEENVIHHTLKNLEGIDYDPALFKVIVIDDNSEDKTGEIASKFDFVDVVRTDNETYKDIGVGKPRALQYTYLKLVDNKTIDDYDMILVLDADNYVDSNILTELNSQIISKGNPEAIQTYIDSKNHQNILSLGYAVSYWTMNRFFQLAKYRLKLPNSIGGTGFTVSIKWLKEFSGFSSTSLTEDLEMEIRIVENDGRVLFNHFARVYDEKPLELKASMIQRFRWSKGHWFVAFSYTPRLVKLFLKQPKYKFIDQLGYLFSMRENFQILIATSIFIGWILQIIGSLSTSNGILFHLSASYVIPVTILNFAVLIYGFVPVTYGYIVDSRQSNKDLTPIQTICQMFKIYIAFLYFSFTYMFCQIWGLFNFKDQGSWAKTKHSINYDNKEES